MHDTWSYGLIFGDFSILAKPAAGSPDDDPNRVEGLAGATLTSRGVTNLLHFSPSEQGLEPFLEPLRADPDALAAARDEETS